MDAGQSERESGKPLPEGWELNSRTTTNGEMKKKILVYVLEFLFELPEASLAVQKELSYHFFTSSESRSESESGSKGGDSRGRARKQGKSKRSKMLSESMHKV